MGTPATLVSAWGCIPLPHWRVWPPVHNPLQGCGVPSKYTHRSRGDQTGAKLALLQLLALRVGQCISDAI